MRGRKWLDLKDLNIDNEMNLFYVYMYVYVSYISEKQSRNRCWW